MSIKPSLRILLDHARRQSDTSAKKLGQLTSQHQQADKKLQLLLDYQHSYQCRLQDLAKTGIDHMAWLNFIAFMNKLDAAITEQRIKVTNARNNRETGGDEFLSCQRKLKSYDILSKRHQQTETQQQMKYEQKEQDEYASNTSACNKFIPKEKQST
ncbi:MAG: flagellar export protein FliJ [Nitrosomonas sp.]|nr:flagellar export protein FliJ [Nitrosomonas sp.]MDP1949768.1 flagellar export protein FliJ [Nitrosomonas sp.]